MQSDADGVVQGARAAAAPQSTASSTALPVPQLPAHLPEEVLAPTEPDEVFDRYARLVTTALGVPVGLVSLVSTDGQVFPGAVGLPSPWQQTRCTGLSHSFCQHVVAHDSPLITPDARQDPRLADNLAIDDIGVIAYAGFPLHDADGTAVGSLCAIDTQPRAWTQRELDVLADLATTAASELVLRRTRSREAAAQATAQAATARSTEVVESMAIGYLSMDTDWRITHVNTEGRRVLGATGREIVGEVIWDLYPATVGTEYETNYRAAAQTGRTVTFDAYYPAPLDAWFELRATPEVGPSGTGVALYFLDITARRAAQEAAELSGRRLGAVGEVALALAGIQDVTDLVTAMAEQGLRALGADGGAVAVPDADDPGQLWSYITASYGEGVQAAYGHLSTDAPLPVCEAHTSGRPVLLPDGEAASAYSSAMADVVASTGCTAWACVPLRAGGEVIGVLTAGWQAAQPFDAEQLDLLETLASQCSQALQRLAARDAEQAAAEAAHQSATQQAALVAIALALDESHSEEEVLAVVTRLGVSMFGAQGGVLCLQALAGHSGPASAVHGVSDGSEAAGAGAVGGEVGRELVLRAMTSTFFNDQLRADIAELPTDYPLPMVDAAVEGATYFFPDRASALALHPSAEPLYIEADTRAAAVLPLRAEGRLVGSLSLSFGTDRTWTTPEQELAQAFAALTAQALERIAARDAERAATAAARTSAGQQASLVAVARALGEADTEDEVLAVVATHGLSLLEASVSGLCLPDGDGVRVVATEGVPGDLRTQWQHLSSDTPLPFVQAAVTGAAYCISDAEQALRLFPAAEHVVTAMGLQAQASLPLRARGRLLGSLNMGFTHVRAWPQADVELVEAFAALTAQALERISAHDAEQVATIQQATLVALASALGRAQSEAEVFTVAAARSIGLLGAFGSGMCLREPDGRSVRTLATETISDAVRVPLQHLPADYPMPIVDTAISGTPHFMVDRAAAAARFSAAQEHYTAGGVQASAQVPLLAQGQLLGSLSLAFAEARPWPPADRAVVEAFAALVAQALARIASHDAERSASAEVARFSETLQRSLLTSPPEPDHLHIAVRYSPAAAQAQVGGDWYDAFITADGSTSLVIGDVTGHDRTAAAAMGQLRNLLRGIAYAVGDPPAAILRVLDRAAHDLAVDTTATLVLARLEQTPEQRLTGERLLRWSNAGHPPPLLVTPDGSARYLEAPSDLLLGINADIPRHDHEVVLAPGSTVLLYTDGLVERRGAPLQDGLDWLLDAVTALADLPVDELCDALLEQVGGQLDDDVAVLALRAYREDEPRPAEAGPGYDPREVPVPGATAGA